MSVTTTTWGELVAQAQQRLADEGPADVERPDVEARRLVEEASGYEGVHYHQCLDRHPEPMQIANLERMLGRRLAGEPLQYALGRWSFRGLDLMVDSRVLIPRPETEFVVDVAIAEAERITDAPLCVDLGTGSGAIALSLAVDLTKANVWATDASEDALAVARANCAGLGRAATRVRLEQGFWFDALDHDLEGRIDVVVSNPPYIADGEDLPSVVADHEPTTALFSGPTGLESIQTILEMAPPWLSTPAAVVLEIAPHQADAATEIARRVGFVEVAVHKDLAGRERALVARWL